VRLSTYINAAVKAHDETGHLLTRMGNPFGQGHTYFTDYERRHRQAAAFHRRAIALADEQDQLIALQAAELDGFMRVMQEAQ